MGGRQLLSVAAVACLVALGVACGMFGAGEAVGSASEGSPGGDAAGDTAGPEVGKLDGALQDAHGSVDGPPPDVGPPDVVKPDVVTADDGSAATIVSGPGTTCNGAACSGVDVCCVGQNGGKLTSAACIAVASCPTDALYCDGSDCPAPKPYCCAQVFGSVLVSSRCLYSPCAAGSVRLCDHGAQCPSGTCAPAAALQPPGMGVCQ